MNTTRYFCDRCAAEVGKGFFGRRLFYARLGWISQCYAIARYCAPANLDPVPLSNREVHLCKQCAEDFDSWLYGFKNPT